MKPRGRKDKPVLKETQENAIREEINRKAYERFELRGRIHGYHMEDWLDAEREVRKAKKGRPAVPARRRAASRRVGSRKTGSAERRPGA